jgi:DNA mismatch repair protein MutS
MTKAGASKTAREKFGTSIDARAESRVTPQKSAGDTPVMRQFHAAKAQYPDALLFFRMGDFYELFYEDAVIAAKALELTLTSRNKGAADEIPMAGVPHHAASAYLQRLLEQGYRVAICEQMADPATVKGIVPREVVRVVSPGLPFDEASLSPREHLFLAAIERASDPSGDRFGLAAVDVSTCELFAVECSSFEGVLAELRRWEAREIVLDDRDPASEGWALVLSAEFARLSVRRVHFTHEPDVEAIGALLKGATCSSTIAQRAIGSLLALIRLSEPKLEAQIHRFSFIDARRTLVLDDAALRHLELVRTFSGDTEGSLLSVLDRTQTAGGARLLRARLVAPLFDLAAIRRRHDEVEAWFAEPELRARARRQLGEFTDVARVVVRLSRGRGVPKDLVLLRRSLRALPELRAALAPLQARLTVALPDLEDIAELLERAIAEDPPVKVSDGGVLREGFDAALDEARRLKEGGQRLLLELEERLRHTHQIPTLKVKFTRVFGWYLEVSRGQAARAPKDWRRKQTVATGERYTTDELDDLAERLASAEDDAARREAALFTEVTTEVAAAADRFFALAEALSACDVAVALADVAHARDYVRPEMCMDPILELTDARHPVVEARHELGRFVPNDVQLSAVPHDASAARLWLITGPNMAGKSTFMRQVALAAVMAHVGSFVPAKHARIGLVDRVMTRVGASDNLGRGESTFMVEMKETASVLRLATAQSLVVLDEIGRGTSTFDGLAIAWAVAEYLEEHVACRALFATHYHELTALGDGRPTVQNFSVSAREHQGSLVFLHRLERGKSSRSYGVACARLAGVPEPVLARAGALLRELEARERPGRGRSPQLSLFAAPLPSAQPDAPMHAPEPKTLSVRDADVLATLRAVALDATTPLEALNILSRLRAQLSSPE